MKSLEERHSSARSATVKAQQLLEVAEERYKSASEEECRLLAIAGLKKGAVVDIPRQGGLVRGTVLSITGEHARIFVGEGETAAIIQVYRHKLYPVGDVE